MSDRLWQLIDQRSKVWRSMKRSKKERASELRRLNRDIRRRLKVDQRNRAREVGDRAEEEVRQGRYREAWALMRGWYRDSGERGYFPMEGEMEELTGEYEESYAEDEGVKEKERLPIWKGQEDTDDSIPREE